VIHARGQTIADPDNGRERGRQRRHTGMDSPLGPQKESLRQADVPSSAVMNSAVELVLDARAQLGEGALWDARRRLLYWIDILAHELHLFEPAAREDRMFKLGQPVGTVVPRHAGGVMLALRDGFSALDLETEQLTFIADPEHHQPGNRFNDGKCDPAGRFWAGTMPMGDLQPTGSLYHLDPDGTVNRMLEGVSCSNGITWSRDRRTMYYIDTPTFRVDAFDYDERTGEIGNRRPAVAVPKELCYPDGSTMDAEDMLWIAHWGSSRVTRWDPRRGKLLGEIRLPVTQVTSVAFGGPHLDELYITTAAAGLDEAARAEQPDAGGLFRARPGVAGLPAFEYAG